MTEETHKLADHKSEILLDKREAKKMIPFLEFAHDEIITIYQESFKSRNEMLGY